MPAACNEVDKLLQLRLCDGRQDGGSAWQRGWPGLPLLLGGMLLLPWQCPCYERAVPANAVLHRASFLLVTSTRGAEQLKWHGCNDASG